MADLNGCAEGSASSLRAAYADVACAGLAGGGGVAREVGKPGAESTGVRSGLSPQPGPHAPSPQPRRAPSFAVPPWAGRGRAECLTQAGAPLARTPPRSSPPTRESEGVLILGLF